MKQQTIRKIESFLRSLCSDVDILYYINVEDIDLENPFDDIYIKLIESNAFDQEVVYYRNAAEYLLENDPSLRESLQIASDYGFELDNLNSEILASLLKTNNVTEYFYNLEDEINSFFGELQDEIE